jgi:hypothetical protein
MEQRSNRASIIVAIITMLLILGGVFVLNQSMTRSRQVDNEIVSSSESVSTSSSFSSSSSFEEPEEVIEEEDLTTSSTSSSVSSPDPATPTANAGEIIATVDAKTAGTNALTSYTFDIKGSAYEDSTYFRSGRRTNLNLSQTNLEIGKSYRIAIAFVDNNDGTFRVNSVRVVEEVQLPAGTTSSATRL